MSNMTDTTAPFQQSIDALQLAAGYGKSYVEAIADRRVAPLDADISALQEFDIALPASPRSAEETLRDLDRLGSPATVATTGGRFLA